MSKKFAEKKKVRIFAARLRNNGDKYSGNARKYVVSSMNY